VQAVYVVGLVLAFVALAGVAAHVLIGLFADR
jgi:hypothetical protein